jgi:hypothetical protein
MSIHHNKNKMSTTVNDLRSTIAFYREALAKAETQLRDIEEPVDTRPMSQYDFIMRIIAMEKRPAYKRSWKKVIEEEYLLENIQRILYDCYDAFCDPDSVGSTLLADAAKARFGKIGSRQWQEFNLLVIKYLRDQGSLIEEDGSFSNYEDTAGGCDEVVWMAGCFLIENPDWQ